METVSLEAKIRHERGSKKARAARREKKIPAILYGHGMEPMSLEVQMADLYNVLNTKAGENVLINLRVEGTELKESTCRLKEIQHDPVTDKIDHIDLTVISMTEKIEVKVPLILKHAEDALGVKEGGVLDVVHHEIEVECLPAQIPQNIEVEVKAMNIGDAVYVRDLAMPEGVICKLPEEEVVVALHAPKKEEEAPVEEEITQPEVIEKGKKLEEEEVETKTPASPKPEKEKKE